MSEKKGEDLGFYEIIVLINVLIIHVIFRIVLNNRPFDGTQIN
jgi:hypothetical protein